MVRKLLRIGNSVGVTLDKKMLRELGMDGASYVSIEINKDKKGILVRKRAKNEW